LLKIKEPYSYCTKRLLVRIRLSLLVPFIYIMYKMLQLFKSLFILNTNLLTSIKVIENTYMQTQKLLKMPSSLKLGLI